MRLRSWPAAHNAVTLTGESPVAVIDCWPRSDTRRPREATPADESSKVNVLVGEGLANHRAVAKANLNQPRDATV